MDEQEQPPPAEEIMGPGLDEYDEAVREALSTPGHYTLDLGAMFFDRRRPENDLIDV